MPELPAEETSYHTSVTTEYVLGRYLSMYHEVR